MRSTPIPPLERPRSDGVIALRHRREDDVETLARASADPDTQLWLGDGPMDVAARLTSVARADEAFRTGRAAPLLVADAGTDEPLGLVNLQFRSDTAATIAYVVFPAARGRGVAVRAVALIGAWADELGVHELRLEIDAANAASLRVAAKSGFVPGGELTDDGKLVLERRR